MSFFTRTKSRSNSFNSNQSTSKSTHSQGNDQQQYQKHVTSEPLFDPPQNYFPAIKYPPLDVSQQILLGKLRDHVNSIMLASGHEYHQNEKRFLTDATLIRHLHARKWDFVVSFYYAIYSPFSSRNILLLLLSATVA